MQKNHNSQIVAQASVAINYTLVKVTEKAFHKNAKTCRAGFHKKPTKQDGTHMTIRSQITIPTSIFPTTHTIIPYCFGMVVCTSSVVNSRIGLWVGVCIEGLLVESKVIVVPWVSRDLYPRAAVRPQVQIPYSIVQVTCAIALL